MAALTITRIREGTVRREYDPNDPADVARVKEEFDAMVPGNLGTVTREGKSETVRKGEFPEGEAEISISPQYQGG